MRLFKIFILFIGCFLIAVFVPLLAKEKNVPSFRKNKGNFSKQKQTHVSGKVIICGVCKDVEKAIPYSIKNLETLGALFDDYAIFIYENNSSDRTAELLKDWETKNKKITITSEIVDDEILSETCFNKTIQNEFYRPERIARARNIVLAQAMNPELDSFQYVIWVDLDFEHPFPFQAIIDTFYSQIKWDAVFANGIDDKGNLYDTYALRDYSLPIGAELIGNQWWDMRGKLKLKLDKKGTWYPVFSAFGGMGIYKRDALKGCKYSALVTKDLESFEKNLIFSEEWSNHREIQLYFTELKKCTSVVELPISPHKEMPYYSRDYLGEGFTLGEKEENGLIFRMNSGVGQYPSICEHVPLHASMSLHGHKKLFVNPALVLHYFGRS